MDHKKAYAFICLLSSLTLGVGGCVGQPTDVTDDAPYDSEEEGELQSTDDPLEIGVSTQSLSVESKQAVAAAQAATTSCAGLPNFTPCGEPTPAFTQCEYGSTCGLNGTQDKLLYNFLCLNQVCTPFPTYVGPVACSRPASATNGLTCATNSCTEYCGSYGSQCDEETTRYRQCSTLTCSNGGCSNVVSSSTSAVGTCTRETDGFDCNVTCSGRPTVGTCDQERCWCWVP